MNAVELLGSILGNKAGSSSGGGSILKDILGGVLGGGSAPKQQQAPAPRARTSQGPGLVDIIRGAHKRYSDRPGTHEDKHCNDPSHAGYNSSAASELDNDQAVTLIRAMVQAAKSDGQLDQNEQDAIVKRLGTVTQEEVNFLQKEFSDTISVRDFAWSVPLGMEEQVYGISLMAIELDQNREASYLRELAHGLRLEPAVCNQIHQQFRAPQIFK
ncbi:MAG: DUF533 domain-containing protein [Planctomycetota bacterium]